MVNKKFKTPPGLIGQRLDVVLAAVLDISRSSALKLIKAGGVTVNNYPAKPPVILKASDAISVNMADPKVTHLPAPSLDVLYEDNELIVVDKPAGLSVHLSETGLPQPTVAAFAAEQDIVDDDKDRPGIVHRLDKDTSGVLVIAKNPEVKAYMQRLFAERKVHKTYWALVAGKLKDGEATITLPVGRSRKQPVKRAVMPGGRIAITHYKVIEELPGATLVEVVLETGRTHQIRVHFSHLGHPVVGDKLYGGTKAIKQLPRQFLHAAEITFVGPSGKTIQVRSDLPTDLADYLKSLRAKL